MLDSYWFGFLLQVAAIGVAGWLVVSLFGAGRRVALALAGVALALLAGQYALGVRAAVGYLQQVDDKFAVTDKAGARTWCVNEPGLPDLNFIRYVQSVMPAGSRYELFLPAGNGQELAIPMCLALILAPSVQVDDPERAQYRIFFGAVPEQYEAQAEEGEPGYHPYAPGYGVLEAGG